MTDAPVAQLATCSYTAWTPQMGLPVRTSVGFPRFWRGPELAFAQFCAPLGIFGKLDPGDPGYSAAYRTHLDKSRPMLSAELARIARKARAERLVLLCFEDVHAGRYCHRLDLARWLEEHTGLEVPELSAPPAQGSLFG